MVQNNVRRYAALWADGGGYLEYPAEMLVRFHNMYLRRQIPRGRVLDYGCGSGNNMRLFIDHGYETHGVEVTDAVLPLVKRVVGSIKRVRIIPPDGSALPYRDGYFDVIVANGVLCYLASESRLRALCDELHRCLRPGGAVYFTMMGPRCYYIARLGRMVQPDTYEVSVRGEREYIYIIRNDQHLKEVFSRFETVTTGFFEQSLFGDQSNFHWIFVGRKA
jgi:SAM-dependent methyltransferase